jgi:histidinol-phosphatase
VTDADLALALQLADAADAITSARFMASDLLVDTKPDHTPVTDADTAVEHAIRDLLAQASPSDGVVGEEFGEQAGSSGARRWILDPIDGTKNFVRGVPVWATLIALEIDAEVAVGVVSAPALSRRWWATRGGGAYADGRRLSVSRVAALADASLSYSSTWGWGPGFAALTGSVWRTRAYGDFWSHVLVAEGAVDISCEPEVSLWDLAALQVIVEEAGGRFTDLSGRRGPAGGSVVCTNGLLHDEVLARLAGRT